MQHSLGVSAIGGITLEEHIISAYLPPLLEAEMVLGVLTASGLFPNGKPWLKPKAVVAVLPVNGAVPPKGVESVDNVVLPLPPNRDDDKFEEDDSEAFGTDENPLIGWMVVCPPNIDPLPPDPNRFVPGLFSVGNNDGFCFCAAWKYMSFIEHWFCLLKIRKPLV